MRSPAWWKVRFTLVAVFMAGACGSSAPKPATAVHAEAGDGADRLAAIVADARTQIGTPAIEVRIGNAPPSNAASLERAVATLVGGLCPGHAGGAYADCTPVGGGAELRDDAWILLGDCHFELGQNAAAVAAYGHVTAAVDTERGAVARYKLAWSYYKLDQFEPAIAAFDDIARLPPGAGLPVLHGEAVTYIAICFTEPWKPDEMTASATALPRAIAHYEAHAEPHAVEVFEEIGDALGDMMETAAAADAYRYAIAHWPRAPRRSELDKKLAAALAAKP